jgi:hypothetical protein
MPTSPRPDSEPRPDAGVPTARPRRRAWGRLLALAGLLSLLSLLFHAWVYGRRDSRPCSTGWRACGRARRTWRGARARSTAKGPWPNWPERPERVRLAPGRAALRMHRRARQGRSLPGPEAAALDRVRTRRGPDPGVGIRHQHGGERRAADPGGAGGRARHLGRVPGGSRRRGPTGVGVKHARGTKLSLGWSSGGEAENREVLSLLPVQGEFYDYRIHTETLFQDTSFPFVANDTAVGGARAPIRKLMIEPTDVAGDLVEIDRLRLISKRSKYAESTHDAGWHRAAGELRKVVFANTPLSITAKVSLPAEPLWLTAGLAVLESGDPVRFKVSVREAAAEKTLFEQSVSAPHAWSDVRLDVSEWGGREVEFRFEAPEHGGQRGLLEQPDDPRRPPGAVPRAAAPGGRPARRPPFQCGPLAVDDAPQGRPGRRGRAVPALLLPGIQDPHVGAVDDDLAPAHGHRRVEFPGGAPRRLPDPGRGLAQSGIRDRRLPAESERGRGRGPAPGLQ